MTDESAAGEVTLPAWETDYRMEGGEMGRGKPPIRRPAIHARRVIRNDKAADERPVNPTTSGHEYVGLTERTPWGGSGPDPRPTTADLAAAARAESCGHVTDEDGPDSHEHDWHDITAVDDDRRVSKCGTCLLTRDDGPNVLEGLLDAAMDRQWSPSSVLTEAERAVTGPRQQDYDHPVRNFALIAQDWRNWIYAAHGVMVPINGRDVAMMNAGQKRCREAHSRKHDNRVDTCGYMRALQLGEESALKQLHGEEVPESERLWKGMLQSTWSYLLE